MTRPLPRGERLAAAAPRRAMVLAAGLGKRLRPLTETVPKPLLAVGGIVPLEAVLDRLAAAGVEEAVINLHHLGERIEAHLAARQRPRIRFSREAELLDTGGGVARALRLLGREPFYVVNGKVVWFDGRIPALRRLAEGWDDRRMDGLLLLHPTVLAVGYEGPGDFFLEPTGLVRRRREREVAPFLFTGIQILHPRLFADAPAGAFSLNILYDRALAAGRLFGLRHDGEWYQVSTPRQREAVERHLGSDREGAEFGER